MTVGDYIPQIDRNPNAKLVDRPSLVKSANGSFVTHLCDPNVGIRGLIGRKWLIFMGL